MSTEVAIIKAGIATTVQDLGRTGYRAYGVPHSGALDPVALKLANLIAGNPPGFGALEMLYSGVILAPRGGSIRVVVVGADAVVEGPATARRLLAAGKSTIVANGERFRVGEIRDTATAYLAIEGGFAIDAVMGSVSTFVRGVLGGWHGRALKSGDVLPLSQRDPTTRPERRSRITALAAPAVLRIMPGPHDHYFARDSRSSFLRSEYSIATASDRSGLRLEGDALSHSMGYDVPSEGMVAGSIQVPGSGLPVVLIGDHPTVGGYPRIATIITADLPGAGRLRIGARVRFAAVDANEASRARAELDTFWHQMTMSIESVDS